MKKHRWWIDDTSKDIDYIVPDDYTAGDGGLYNPAGNLVIPITKAGALMEPDAEQEDEYATLDPEVTGPPEVYREQVQAMITTLAGDALAKQGITPPDQEVLYLDDKGKVKKRKASALVIAAVPLANSTK